jgi:phosphate:Na+ symporter
MKAEWLINLEILIQLFAGLGLFFVGIRMLTENLRQLADRRLRNLMTRATRSNRSAAALGLMGGAVIQSMNAVIFILISLVTAGVLDARRAQPVINFANLGTSLLVLIAALDIRLLVLALVGTTGLLYYFDRDGSARLRQVVRALLGIGLLFLGLLFIKEAAKPLADLSWTAELLTLSGQFLLIAFFSGLVLSMITQSASSVTILTMALATSGLIGLEHALLVVYGAGIGSAVGIVLLAYNHRGLGRQLAFYQLTLKTLGLLLLLPLFWIEYYGGLPLVAAGLSSLPVGIGLQIAFSYILYQVASDIAMHPLHHRVQHLLERYAPPTVAETLGQPRFIYAGAQKDASSALVLVEREQLHLLELLPEYLDSIRAEATVGARDRNSLHRGGTQVAGFCERFLEEVLGGSLSGATLDHAIVLKSRTQILAGLQETLNEFVAEAERPGKSGSPEAQQLLENLAETLHMMLLTLVDAARSKDAEDIEMLRALTADRSDLMHAIRQRMLATAELTDRARDTVFAATSLFERAVWLLRRHAILLGTPRAAQTEPKAPAPRAET